LEILARGRGPYPEIGVVLMTRGEDREIQVTRKGNSADATKNFVEKRRKGLAGPLADRNLLKFRGSTERSQYTHRKDYKIKRVIFVLSG